MEIKRNFQSVQRSCVNAIIKAVSVWRETIIGLLRYMGGALFDIIERDSTASDTEYSLSDIGSKVDDMLTEISSIRNELNELSSSYNDGQRELSGDHNVLAERLNEIEDTLFDIKGEK